MTTKREVNAAIFAAIDAALDSDFTVRGLAAVLTDALLGQFTIQAKRPRGSMQGDAGPQHCTGCVCVIPCASGTCRYPLKTWVNSPCGKGCDCGDCYSRSPDEGPCHCDDRA